MPLKQSAKGKEKIASTSGTIDTRGPEEGIKTFLDQEATSKYFDTISH